MTEICLTFRYSHTELLLRFSFGRRSQNGLIVTKDDLLMISHSKSINIEVCSIQDLTAARNL